MTGREKSVNERWRGTRFAAVLLALFFDAVPTALAQQGQAVEPPASGRVGAVRRGADGKLLVVKPDGEEKLPPVGADAGMRLRPYQEDERRKHATAAEAVQRDLDRRLGELRRQRRPSGDPGKLAAEEEQVIRDLRERDRRVREHEDRHFYVGQLFTKPPEYWTVLAPDGGRYAVSGMVAMDVSPVAGDPAATRRKWETLLRAALAPTDPSERDQALARELQLLLFGLQTTEQEKLNRPEGERSEGRRQPEAGRLPEVPRLPGIPPPPSPRQNPPEKKP